MPEKAAVYFRACGVRVSCPAGSVRHGEFTAVDYAFSMPLEEWLRTQAGKRYFVKPRGGRQALGCFRLVVGSGESPCMVNGEPAGEQDVVRMCEGCLIEPLLVQHEQLRRISPHAVFPIRIRTTRRGDSGPQFLSAYMAVGWKHSYCTNICNGNGIAFAVDEHGYGISDGLMEPDGKGGRGMRMAQHPETGDTFKGYHVPMMEEAIELAIKAHSTLPEIHSIGWDVGILDDGPIIIEGNAEWGTVSYQALMGKGEREYFEKWVKPFPCKNPTHTTYGV